MSEVGRTKDAGFQIGVRREHWRAVADALERAIESHAAR